VISAQIVNPLRIEADWLTAYDHTSGARTFAMHRIAGAAFDGQFHLTTR
jgi:hypothetical protein